MSIEFSLEKGKVKTSSSIFRRYETVELTPQEEQGVKIVVDSIGDKLTTEIHLERRTDNYLTIVVGRECDFCRIKAGKKSSWVSLSLPSNERKSLALDPRLSVVINKNLVHWKIPLSSIDKLKDYGDLILKAYTCGAHQADVTGQ